MSALSLSKVPDLLATLYRRAPASFLTLSSLIVSYLANAAYLDFCLFRAIGSGGYGSPTFRAWLLHALILRPLSMSKSAAKDPAYLPQDDSEWEERIKSSGKTSSLANLPKRGGVRPMTFGFVPHRQIEAVSGEGSDGQKGIISHFEHLAEEFPLSLTMALSTYEGAKAPALFVKSLSTQTRIARLFLSSTPPPKRTLQGEPLENFDTNKHELTHLHMTEGSMHVILSPQDARQVIKQGWGELHSLAGVFYRGYYTPPYWLPQWFFDIFGGQSKARWGYLQQRKSDVAKSIPPTYCMLYSANTPEQLEWTKAILDASVAWALGQPL